MLSPAWTPKKERRRNRGSIGRARRAMLAVAHGWGDVDNTVVEKCDEVCAALDALAATIDDAVAYDAERERDRKAELKATKAAGGGAP